MEIFKILKEEGQNLYPDDLDFFITELATGEYEASYIAECQQLITEIRNWQKKKPGKRNKLENDLNIPTNLLVNPSQLTPSGVDSSFTNLSDFDQFKKDLDILRKKDDYKNAFKVFIETRPIITENFIDTNFSIFHPWEIDIIVSLLPLSENFLEKYFGVIDHARIAKHQEFSESFFMKHYAQLDVSLVLRKGKNSWRKKENRSKQLDVFLRLKGVKI